jgi:multicomponent Na+:H+ antiporter subunit D
MLLALPILVPLLTACICFLLGSRTGPQRTVALIGAGGLLASAATLFTQVVTGGPFALHIGGWQAPLGITLVADHLAVLLVLVAAVMHAAATVFALGDIDEARRRRGYFAFLNIMLMGVCGAFLTGDLFNLYVWFEVMLIGSFVLLVLGGGRAQLRAGVIYVALSLLSSALFLGAIGIIYGIAHTLNMADLSVHLAVAAESDPWLVTAVSVLLVVAFGIKAAVFPLHFWLPDSYDAPPPAVTAIFAALLTKTGVYALLRVFTLVIPGHDYIFGVLAIIAGLTMVVGVLGAVSQAHVRRILNVHIVSQIGYMIMGVALLTADDPATRTLAVAATIFYLVHNMIVKTNLLLLGGVVRGLTGEERLARLGGLLNRTPLIAILFLVSALSLAGLPPSSGFWAKLGIIRAGFEAEAYLLTGVAIAVGLLTLFSMLKIWTEVFWKPEPADDDVPAGPTAPPGRRLAMLAPPVVLTALAVAIGLYPQPLLVTARTAAEQLLDRPAYVALLGIDAAPPDRPLDETTEGVVP